MRRLSLFLLLATAAAPALAASDDAADRRAERAAAREARSEARSERADRPARVERGEPARTERSEPARVEREAPARQSFDRPDRPQRLERAQRIERAQGGDFDAPERVREQRRVEQQDSPDSVRNWRGRERQRAVSPARIEQRNSMREKMQTERQQRIENRSSAIAARPPRTLPVSTVPQPGTQPPPPAVSAVNAARSSHLWNTDWRHDHRYDWSNHRRHHRSLFHLGFYYDPFGWGYSRYYTGWRLWPSFYSSNYWLSDPYMYRLPYAPYPYKWVRYYDDALLVDTWSGEVVDVIYDFFW